MSSISPLVRQLVSDILAIEISFESNLFSSRQVKRNVHSLVSALSYSPTNSSSVSSLNKPNNLHVRKRFAFQSSMTNKPRTILLQNTNKSDAHVKPHTTNGNSKFSNEYPYLAYSNSSRFQTMAAIQKLATEPSREHIENIRHVLKKINARDNDDQQITLHKDEESKIASICIKSAAKNGISAKMMCDFLDTIDELYSWQEGKGVIIYGHDGFFCSGEFKFE